MYVDTMLHVLFLLMFAYVCPKLYLLLVSFARLI
jgi:hypothetical protein